MSELKWAVEKARNWNDPDQSFEDTNKSLDIILDLATKVLVIDGMMPKEKEIELIIDNETFEEVHNDVMSYGNEQYNLARQQCILAITKKLEGLEEVIDTQEVKVGELEKEVNSKRLAHTIQSHLLGEKG